MFFTVYKIINAINGKYYIGKHKTKNLDDGYIGSGKLLKRAIKKYGINNFHKEILFVCKNEKCMNTIERILVVPDEETNYNLCAGGNGGFGYINENDLNHFGSKKGGHNSQKILSEKRKNDKDFDLVFRHQCSNGQKKRHKNGNGFVPTTKGIKFSETAKEKMSASHKGSNNSQYGTCWITDGTTNKKIDKNDLSFWLTKGYNKGRVRI